MRFTPIWLGRRQRRLRLRTIYGGLGDVGDAANGLGERLFLAKISTIDLGFGRGGWEEVMLRAGASGSLI